MRDLDLDTDRDEIDTPAAALAWMATVISALLLCGWAAHEVARLVGWVR